MKLNPDCIRGILLTVEEKCNFDTPWEYDRDTFESEYLAEFSHEEIVYHIKQASVYPVSLKMSITTTEVLQF